MDNRAVARALDIFEAFETMGRPCTLTELAELTASPVSSCHMLVKTLKRRGYLAAAGRRNLIYPTARLSSLSANLVARNMTIERFNPAMTSLRDTTKETILLGRRHVDRVVYLDVVQGLHGLRYSARPGDTAPLAESAMGKALQAPHPAQGGSKRSDRGEAGVVGGCRPTVHAYRGSVGAIGIGISVSDAEGGWLGIEIAGPAGRMRANLDGYMSALVAACLKIDEVL